MSVRSAARNGSDAPDLAIPAEPVATELKLLAAQGDLEKLRELPVIVEHARNRGTFRRLESVYYDTPDKLLIGHGMSLGVRRNGKHYLQTLRRLHNDGRPPDRQQWEVPVDDIVPDLARLPADEVGNPITALSTSSLVPVFTIRIGRHAQRLDFPDASIEILFDKGSIEAGTRKEDLSEIELKLKGGKAAVLFDLGAQLLDAAPLQLGTRSKAEHGYLIAFDVVQPAVKATLPDITAEHAVNDVIARHAEACWHHILKNFAVVQEGSDTEGVHQMRIALRRLRTICVMFRHDIPSPVFQTIDLEAEWLMHQLGRAREWDVFAETIADLAAAPLEIDFSGLREVVERQRGSSRDAVQAVLADPRCSRFLLALGHVIERCDWRNEIDSEALMVLDQPVSEHAGKILTRLHHKALKRGTDFRHLDFAAQHKLRIDLKKLRYAAEFLSPLYADHAPAKRYAKRLARLQSSLGRVCDIVRNRALLETIRQNDQPMIQFAAGVVAGWQAHDQSAATKVLRKRWRRFKAAGTFWHQ
ncbi:MAG: CYTH and CHAD domain-containing protein [Afipia sp.]